MTYDLSKVHLRSLGAGSSINRTAALIVATLSTAVIGGVWASILRVDPARLSDSKGVWMWLGLQAFPALVVIVGLFLLPLYFMILRPAGQKDPTVAILAICGAGTLAMLAALMLISGPRELMAYVVFQIENAYVRVTLDDMNTLERDVRAAETASPEADPPGIDGRFAQATRRARLFGAAVEKRAAAFEVRRRKVRVDLAARLGGSRAGRERLIVFDQQATNGERLVERYWALHVEYAQRFEAYVDILRRNQYSPDASAKKVWQAGHDLWEVERDIGQLHDTLQGTPFLNRTVRWPTRPAARRP
ncbi:MAG: hypothetical protein GC145_11260 [Caulobacter sp.]|nr:hypothetical protein [Caulobacter sp.]